MCWSFLARARADWHQWRSPVAFSLTATTGAGKTVMAAAVIEALFDGNPPLEFDPDPGAVVLWFTDDPSLNEQTRFRLLAASDRIAHSRLVVIEKHLQPRETRTGQGLLPQPPEAGEEVASGQGNAGRLSAGDPSASSCRCRTRAPTPCGTPWRTPSPTNS